MCQVQQWQEQGQRRQCEGRQWRQRRHGAGLLLAQAVPGAGAAVPVLVPNGNVSARAARRPDPVNWKDARVAAWFSGVLFGMFPDLDTELQRLEATTGADLWDACLKSIEADQFPEGLKPPDRSQVKNRRGSLLEAAKPKQADGQQQQQETAEVAAPPPAAHAPRTQWSKQKVDELKQAAVASNADREEDEVKLPWHLVNASDIILPGFTNSRADQLAIAGRLRIERDAVFKGGPCIPSPRIDDFKQLLAPALADAAGPKVVGSPDDPLLGFTYVIWVNGEQYKGASAAMTVPARTRPPGRRLGRRAHGMR